MKCVLFAESAILVHFKSVRIIFLVFHCVIVSLFAFCASQCDFNSHLFHPFVLNKRQAKNSAPFFIHINQCFFTTQIKPLFRGTSMLSQKIHLVNGFL